ncbi:hypothetical protein [Pseudofrankia asymbiotica]|uniref:Uncharacterized protein n=1 Tax=Pseudofrankia asymbiotica TaxID=1834516 RepID=A0A1V2I1B2_9ACTN|nr:hypothetical protein [Pseudofrankia asymbiotica]ONH23558.1 hypothetical protein BL253_32745 [Pseudofrankia asymbiotica]
MTHILPLLGPLTVPLFVVTVGYGLLCWVRPFRPCRHCDGTGRTTGRVTRRPRPCRHCDYTGLTLRAGRRLANALRRLR